ncbi:MAG: sulfatase [Thermomicrobiales bacterium]
MTPQTPDLSRRRLLQTASAGAASLLLGPLSGRLPAAAQETPPNIVLILTDDMRASDLPYMATAQSLLVEEGATFPNFTVTSPGCGPARASILRGQYPHGHGVLRGKGDTGGVEQMRRGDNESSTIATWLQDAGYHTALIGKYLNGYGSTPELLAIPPGWDDWFGVSNEGYSRFTINENGEAVRYTSRKEEVHLTDVLADKAQQVITAAATAGDPFFLHISTRAPHGPAEPASWHVGAFADTPLPDNPAMNETDVSDKPNWVQILPPLTERQMAEEEQYFQARLETLLSVDELIADIVQTLEEQEILDETYIILTSDNGYSLGEHRVSQEKGSAYEEAVLVPLVIRGPGIAPGVTLDLLASQVDLAPTFATWGGAEIPAFVDGRSLTGVLAGEPVPADWRQFGFIEQFVNNPSRTDKQPAFQALRTASMVYVNYGTGEQELYDLIADPYETENRASAADPALLAAYQERAEAMLICAGATCREIEQQPIPRWPAAGASATPVVS